MSELAAYSSLFLSAFSAATLLPGSSEALLAGFVATEKGTLHYSSRWQPLAMWRDRRSIGRWDVFLFSIATENGFQCRRRAINGQFGGMSGSVFGRCCWPGCPLSATR